MSNQMNMRNIKTIFGLAFITLFIAYVAGVSGTLIVHSEKTQNNLIEAGEAGKYRILQLALLARQDNDAATKQEMTTVIAELDNTLLAMQKGGSLSATGEELQTKPAPDELQPGLTDLVEKWQACRHTLTDLTSELPQAERAGLAESAAMQTAAIDRGLSTMISYLKESREQARYHSLLFIILYSALFALLTMGAFILLNRYVASPLETIRHTTAAIATGKLDKILPRKAATEIDGAIDYINLHTENLEKAAGFAKSIGQGTFDKGYQPAGDDDQLGAALLNMSKQLQEVDIEDKKRSWVNEGLTKFAHILREERDDLEQMCSIILSNLVKYMEANQGGLFVINDVNERDPHLELKAVYAYDRKKYITKTIQKGEGLVGQAWLEGEITYMTEVPDNYVTITSGMGESTPTSLIIVPLKLNDDVLGVVEIASFRAYEPYERNFLEKLSESIASTLSSVKVNERTRSLLEQSQQQSEEMRAQEEEMRQNMEELQATQENMERKEREHLAQIERLEERHKESVEKFKRLSVVADNTDSAVVITGADGRIQFINPGFMRLTGYDLQEALDKKPGELLQGPDTDPAAVSRMREALSKQKGFYEEVLNYTKDGREIWVALTVNPVFENGTLANFVAIQADITLSKKASQDFTYQLNAINKANLVIEFDTGGHVLDCNENFVRTMQYDKQDLIGKHHSLLVPEQDQDEAYRQMWKDLAAGKPLDGTFTRIKADGNIVWLKSVYTPILDFKGRAYKVVKYAQDVSGQAMKQEEMRQTLEQAVDAVITINGRKEIEYMNPAATEMFGFTFDEVKGQNVKILVPDEHRTKHDGYVDSNIETGTNKVVGQSRELQMQHKDGSRFWGLLSLSRINVNGQVRYTSFIKNIQAQKELEMQVREQFENLQESQNQIQASEEELRQNMEEVMAIQEDMERVTRNYAQILEQAVDAVITIDSKKNISFYNEAAEKMFGFTADEVKGKNVKMIVPLEHRSQHDKYIDSNIGTGKNKVVGKGRFIKGRHKNGREFEALLTLSKVKSPEGYQYTAFIKSMDELKSLLHQMEDAVYKK